MVKLSIKKSNWLSNKSGILNWWIYICVCTLVSCTESSIDAPPNVILIMADDMGVETLSCYGGTSYQTPHLDNLASQGIVFDQCYSTPLCTPSRVQLMTGKYNFRNYVGFGILDSNEYTFGHLFQELGYQTCVVGKWQLYGNDHQYKLAGQHGTLPKQAGFDEYCLWQVKDRGPRYKHPVIDVNGQLQNFPNQFGPDVFTQYVMDFVTRNRDKSFFVYFPMCLVHDPFVPTPWSENYDSSLTKKSDTTYFSDMMIYMDHQIGKIIGILDAQKISENTLVLFIGDNGTSRQVYSTWNNQQIKGEKGFPNKWGTHVPFIARWNNAISPGIRSSQLVDFTDFFATFQDITDSALRDDIDGQSFLPILKGKSQSSRKYVFNHYDPIWGKFKKSRHVHDGEWKLYDDGRFYHISSDYSELNNLADSTLKPEIVEIKSSFNQILAKMQ